MSDYKHDIFLSYRRTDKHWIRWANEIIAEALATLLGPAIGSARIFRDTALETGTPWPRRLAEAHARSRILVPLLSRDYFTSDWCRLELALMHDREKRCNLRSVQNQAVLIIPFVIDDGQCFPPEIQEMQLRHLNDYANQFLRPKTRDHWKLTEILRKECPRIESALSNVPPFDVSWEQLAHAQFQELFKIQTGRQTTLPALSLINAAASPER